MKQAGRVKPKAKAKAAAKLEVKVSEGSGVSEPVCKEGSGFGSYKPHFYSEKYRIFVQAAKNNGATCAEAKAQWISSQERANLLADMPLPELKRRRFVCKECQSNPFVHVNAKAALGGC